MRTFLRSSRNRHKPDALTVYSAGPGALIRKLAESFTQDTGINVNVQQETTGKIMDRLDAEADNPRADVVISASWDSAHELEQRGWLLPIEPRNGADVLDTLKSNTCIAQGISVLGLIWNQHGNSPAPRDWNDLTDVAYKGLITTPDPALSGASTDLLIGLQTAFGEDLWALLETLKGNGMALSGANAQALAPVLRGTHEVVFGGVDYIAHSNIKQGAPIRFIIPTSGTVIAPRPMMVLNTSKRAGEALAFIEHILRDDGQALVAQAGLMPARAAGKRHPLDDIPLLPKSGSHTTHSRKQIIKRFSGLFADPLHQ